MIISHSENGFAAHLEGNQPRNQFILSSDLMPNDAKQCFVKVASGKDQTGFQTIESWTETLPDTPLHADGIVMTATNQTATFHTADCPAVIMSEPTRNIVVALHAGRPALTFYNNQNVITNALQFIENPANTYVYITGGICGTHFAHDQDNAKPLALPFLDTFGESVFSDVISLSLNLQAVIETQLINAGIPAAHIKHDNICTFETKGLASHRRDGSDRTTTNTVTVVTR